MRIGILGTGVVGTTIGTKLIREGHEVILGALGTPVFNWHVAVGKT